MSTRLPLTTPAIVTEQAAQHLPRAVLIALILIYAVAGFFGREPFKPIEINQLGYLYLANQNQLSQWAQGVNFDHTLHPLGFSVWATRIVAALPADWAFFLLRTLCLIFLIATLTLSWMAAKKFASLSAAQPVSFAFGGEAKPNDYATAIADSTALALIASLGFSQFGHELSPFLLQILSISGLLLALARTQGSGLWRLTTRTLALLSLSVTGAPVLALGLSVLLVIQATLTRSAGRRDREIILHVIMAVITALVIGMLQWSEIRIHWEQISLQHLPRAIQLLVWFTWPIWPMVIWTMWKWRLHWFSKNASIHLLSPILLSLGILLHACLIGQNDRWYFLSLPPLALLAALALPTLTRGVSSIIDWFTMILFTGSSVVIWLFWIAGVTGWPVPAAQKLQLLISQNRVDFNAFYFIVACCVTLAWIWLVIWRTGRHRTALWKSLALPAGGAATCWVLLTTLWLPYLNQSRSLVELGTQIREALSDDSCVYVWNLSTEQVSAIYFYTPVKTIYSATEMTGTIHCRILIANLQGIANSPGAIDSTVWHQTHQLPGNRVNRDDDVVIFQRH